MTLEFEPGSFIRLDDGTRAVCEEAKCAKCLDCVMKENECEGFLCFPEERKDGKYVYFRKLEEGGKA